MQKIIIRKDSLWQYITEKSEELKGKMHMIAENSAFGIEIWIEGDDEGDFWIVVEEDNDEIYREQILNEKDCLEVADRVFGEYLEDFLQKAISSDLEDVSEDEEYQALIDDREEEIDLAFVELMETLSDSLSCNFGEGVMTDIKEHVLEYIARKHKIKIYRPMMLEDVDSGEEFFSEHPYENMVFDDNNPIYTK